MTFPWSRPSATAWPCSTSAGSWSWGRPKPSSALLATPTPSFSQTAHRALAASWSRPKVSQANSPIRSSRPGAAPSDPAARVPWSAALSRIRRSCRWVPDRSLPASTPFLWGQGLRKGGDLPAKEPEGGVTGTRACRAGARQGGRRSISWRSAGSCGEALVVRPPAQRGAVTMEPLSP